MRKSPCCASSVRRFGRRRRQCSSCLRTWRYRTKKRGRPRLRSDSRLFDRILIQRRSLTELARARGVSRQALCHRFKVELNRQIRRGGLARTTRGRAILIIDGLWFKFKRRPWVIYLMALRPVRGNTATFIDPCVLPGRESLSGWKAAVNTISTDRKRQVQAIVVDDFTGCTTLADENNWVLQLCHFHMLSRLRARLGFRRPRGVTLISLRQQAYRLVETALETSDQNQLTHALCELDERYVNSELPWKYKNILRQFIRRIQQYRAYRIHPNLRLPKTTGSAEAMGRRIRDLLGRTRSLSTAKALELWARNYVRIHPNVACNAADLSTK